MTSFDFTTYPDRTGQRAVKWQLVEKEPDVLPMWIADMDFLPLPTVQEALKTYATDHVFGYASGCKAFYDAIISWEKDQHGLEVSRESLVATTSVVPAISIAIQALTAAGDGVMLHTPAYPPFAKVIQTNNRKLVRQSLVETNGHFEIDFAAFEELIVEKQVKLYILCNPHNPGGRVWTKAELEILGRICQRHGVIVVSDEIHQDLALFGHEQVSFHTVAEDFADFSIVLSSATKTFNLAGTKASFAIISNPELRKAFVRQQEANYQHELATVGILATTVAFETGKDWLAELKQVLEENIETAISYLEEHAQIRAMKPEGTYLIWLDFSAYDMSHEEIQRKLLEEARVQLNDGLVFGKEGRYKARFNIAAPLFVVQEACERIARVFGKAE